MPVIDQLRNVATVIGIDVPSIVFGSGDREHVELASMVNRVADKIAKSHDWQLLSIKATIGGDDVTTAWPPPSDYDRFTDDGSGESRIWTPLQVGPMYRVKSTNEWLAREVQAFGQVTYSWIMLGGAVNVKPALPIGKEAYYYYQSNAIVQRVSDAGPEFTSDTDTFRLNERLLELGVICEWRAKKHQPYSEEMADYEDLLAKMATRDKGARSLTYGRRTPNYGAAVAYPQVITS